jgi:hypothetical protein
MSLSSPPPVSRAVFIGRKLLKDTEHRHFLLGIKEAEAKSEALTDLIQQLPKEHYDVLGYLMLHLHRYVKPRYHHTQSTDMPVVQSEEQQRGKPNERPQSGRRLWP